MNLSNAELLKLEELAVGGAGPCGDDVEGWLSKVHRLAVGLGVDLAVLAGEIAKTPTPPEQRELTGLVRQLDESTTRSDGSPAGYVRVVFQADTGDRRSENLYIAREFPSGAVDDAGAALIKKTRALVDKRVRLVKQARAPRQNNGRLERSWYIVAIEPLSATVELGTSRAAPSNPIGAKPQPVAPEAPPSTPEAVVHALGRPDAALTAAPPSTPRVRFTATHKLKRPGDIDSLRIFRPQSWGEVCEHASSFLDANADDVYGYAVQVFKVDFERDSLNPARCRVLWRQLLDIAERQAA